MRLAMAGMDHTTAGTALRGAFAAGAAGLAGALRRAAVALPPGAGCVLLATCNRTELYVSYPGNDASESGLAAAPDCVAALCEAFGQDPAPARPHFAERREEEAAAHLMRVAAGLRSGVPGESQITAQVRAAVDAARDAGTADALLSALFRAAVAAGKRIRAAVPFARDNASVAESAVREILRRLAPGVGGTNGGAAGKRALVVGNGAVGILAAKELLAAGLGVSMTLRDARRRTDLPPACRIVPYDARHEALDGCDVVVCATSAPGFVLTEDGLRSVRRPPPLFVDLAVPQDIDPAAVNLGAVVLNIDDLSCADAGKTATPEELERAEAIIREESDRFFLWRRNRTRRTAVRERSDGAPDFPLFISLRGAPVLIAGGGGVAARRAAKLLAAGARVHVVSPAICAEMEKLLAAPKNGAPGNSGALRWTRSEYAEEHMPGSTLALAATDDRSVNRRVGEDARARGILVSVADRREECTFYFPAIVRSDSLSAGLVSANGDHALVKRAAARLQTEMESIDADNQSGKPRE